MNYKYNIGDKVNYTKTIRKEHECPTCNNIENVYSYEERESEVEERMYDTVYSFTNGFIDTKSERDENGMLVHKPYISEPKLAQQVPVYKVDGSWYTEESLSK